MGRKVRDSNLETRTGRARLKAGPKPYYRALGPGLHVGYRKGKIGGRWVARWYTGDGRYVLRTLDGIADDSMPADGEAVLDFGQAQEAARRIYSATKRPAPVAGPLTVREAVATYVTFLKAEKATGADAEKRLAKHVLPAIGDKVVAELAKADVDGVKRGMVRSDPDDADAERRSKDTANRVLSSLKAALNMAFRDPANQIPSDVTWRTVAPFRDVGRAREVHLDVAQSKRLINSSPGRFRDLVTAALLTGARLGELREMRASDFRADLGTLSVRGAVVGARKTGARDVVLTGEGVRFFDGIAAGKHPDALLLPRDDGKAWTNKSVERAMADPVTRAKLPADTVFYSLRHTHISQALLGQMNLHLLGQNLGTSVRMIEQAYGKFLAASRRKLIEEHGFKLGLRQKSNVATMRPKRRPAA